MPFMSIPQNWVPALPHSVSIFPPNDVITMVNAGNYAAGTGQMGTIARTPRWRADRQRPMQLHINIQIQLNAVDPPSTVACLLVPLGLAQHTLPSLAPLGRAATPENRFRELTHAIQTGLIRSYETWQSGIRKSEVQVFMLAGNFSTQVRS